MPVEVMADTLRRWDHHRRRILLSEALLPSARPFHPAVQIAVPGHRGRPDRIVERVDLPGDEAAELSRMTQANSFPVTAIMPMGAVPVRPSAGSAQRWSGGLRPG